jgi:hypothetical protein
LPIFDHATENLEAVRKQVGQKRDTISRYGAPVYVETSHAFLKSWWDLAADYFPQLQVLHLIRNPLEVAKSEANRESFIHRRHLPLRNYRGRDGRKYFRWALTGHEPIFSAFDLARITLFQRYLIQWIEIENRAMDFLLRFDKGRNCMTIHTPQDLNDPQLLARLLDFLRLVPWRNEVRMPDTQNRTPHNPTLIGGEELLQCSKIIAALPQQYLEIFRHDPYAGRPWSALLCK